MSDEARLWTEIGRLGEDPLGGELSDEEIVQAALAGLATAPAETPEPEAAPPSVSRVAVVLGVVMAAAAAVLLGWWLVPQLGLLGPDDGSHEMSPSIADDDESGGQAIERGGERAAADARRPEPAIVGTTGDESTGDGSTSEATTETETDPVATGDEAGDTDGPPAPRSARPAAPRTAAALLERAQQQLSAGDRTGAIASYQRLVERFPGSAEAKAARVSLGRLELRRGKAKQALAHFDAYLASSTGALTEEARYGRIRALRALGRAAQELASIEAFLAEHGDSMYAARLRKRAEELRP